MGALRPDQRVVLVAAHARNRVIGDGGAIPWHLPHDFAHFKRETLGRLGDPVHVSLMKQVKHALDPNNLLNPGKLVP